MYESEAYASLFHLLPLGVAQGGAKFFVVAARVVAKRGIREGIKP